MSELRAAIRALLSEELDKLRASGKQVVPSPSTRQPKQVTVSLRSDAELATFVARLMRMAADPAVRADIMEGRYRFRLAADGAPPPANTTFQPRGQAPSAPSPAVRFDRGLVTEKDVSNLSHDQRHVSLGKAARLTPLARDELRRRGIRIERMKT